MIVAQLRGAKFLLDKDGHYGPVCNKSDQNSYVVARKSIRDVANYLGFPDEDEYLVTLDKEGKDILKRITDR